MDLDAYKVLLKETKKVLLPSGLEVVIRKLNAREFIMNGLIKIDATSTPEQVKTAYVAMDKIIELAIVSPDFKAAGIELKQIPDTDYNKLMEEINLFSSGGEITLKPFPDQRDGTSDR